MPKDRFLLSFYDVQAKSNDKLLSLVESQDLELSKFNADFATPPIANLGPIENPALPDYTSQLPGNFLTVVRFPSQKNLDDYLVNQEVLKETHIDDIVLRTIVTAKVFKPMPMMPKAPILGDIEHRKEPAFLLLNGISMKSMLNPLTPIRMMRYMNANMNKLEAEGVQMLEAFEVMQTLEGSYDYDMLFLTEWPDQETFDRIHNDPDFISLAGKTRNKAFKAFADDKGIIRYDLALDLSEVP